MCVPPALALRLTPRLFEHARRAPPSSSSSSPSLRPQVPSEDPGINGQWGVQYTKGLQEGADKRYLQAIVTLKHWDGACAARA